MSFSNQMSLTVGNGGAYFGLSQGVFPNHGAYQIPDNRDCGTEDLQRGAEALHDYGRQLLGALDHEDPSRFPIDFGGHDWDRWHEIAHLLRSAGEAAELVAAGLRETQGLLDATDPAKPTTSPLMAAFVIEANVQYLMSVGHNLTNAAWRVCLTSRACRNRLVSDNTRMRRRVAATVPETEERSAWLFHSDADTVRTALGTSRTPPARLIKVVARLHQAGDWKSANEARDRYFHRWRTGFAGGTSEAHDLAVAFHTATLRAGRCLGRALPAYFNDLIDAVPRVVRGNGRGMPLSSHPLVWDMTGADATLPPQTPGELLLPRRPFTR